jgi:hyperosmotically inducible periplasmic protein
MSIRKMCFAAATGLLLTVSAVHAEKTQGQRQEDTTVAANVKTALVKSDQVSANDINVEVSKGVVQLGGFVDSEAERTAAVSTARTIDGATKVIDAMVVMKGHRSAGRTIDDGTIEAKLKSSLVGKEGITKGMDINTEVRQGEVLLTGFVPDEKYKAKAGEIAQGIGGVKAVHNNIAIAN